MTWKIYAHRGASEEYAEHTRAAYLQALADGADGVECDLQLSADEELVLLHDDTLDRTSDGTGPVGEHTLEELRALDFSSWKGVRVPAEYGGPANQLLTLSELLEILLDAGRPVGLAIEFKHAGPFGPRLEERTLEVLLDAGWLPQSSQLENIAISFMSFHPEAVKYLAQTVPARHLCQLVADVDVADIREEMDLGALSGEAVAVLMRRALAEGERLIEDGVAGLAGPGIDYVRAHPDTVAAWRQTGARFRVWTVDAAADVEHCVGLGIEEITTNRPAALRGLRDAASV
ncbi:glycerophosphodiester phosphodiesterase [Arthrobacter sp. 35W]|uniref:glycerophosphodiester phosphodiesterase n=1 Tax=Arthrobacter sp. 35W TaxID=1132441 RepID=UPI0003F82E14|nr:glycerophosphodiester phosphodiesterase family protein [Arthrobacter sp. 35W]